MPLDTLHGVNDHIQILQPVSACEIVKRNIRNFIRQNNMTKTSENAGKIQNGEYGLGKFKMESTKL